MTPAQVDELLALYQAHLRAIYTTQTWMISMNALLISVSVTKALARLGVERALCMGPFQEGVVLPEVEGIELTMVPLTIGATQGSIMESIRLSQQAVDDLPQDARASIEAFDPSGQARVIGPIVDNGRPIAGRAKFGARPHVWQLLEDKLTIDALWDDLKIARPPSRIVELHDTHALALARRDLDQGHGVVWAGDFSEGFHGGGDGVRWIQSDAHEASTQREFSKRFERVRVTPFLEGLPCSIHAIVFPTYTVALIPCEMVVFRQPGHTQFKYSSAATFWRPRDEDAHAMRSMARHVGDALRERVGYRGALTIDGVMTKDGFMPTELNPRFGAALHILGRNLAERLDLMLLNLAIVEGEDVDWRPKDLEALLLHEARTRPSGSAMSFLSTPIDTTTTLYMRYDLIDDAIVMVEHPEDATIEATAMPHGSGGLIRCRVHDAPAHRGRPLGPLAIRVINAAALALELPIESWEAAPDVRPRA